jgi:hypothetical protein
VGSIAFQLTVALYPDTLHTYAWLIKYVWFAWVVIWVIWLASHPQFLGRLFGGGKDTPPVPTTSGPSQIANPSMVANPSMTANPTINVYPPLALPAPSPARSSQPGPTPNLRLLGTRATWFTQEQEGRPIHEDREKHFNSSIAGAVACFRNESSTEKTVAGVSYVRGSISFIDDDGKEIGEGISEACWVDKFGSVDFDVRQSHCLIVAVLGSNGEVCCPYVEEKHSSFGAFDAVEGLTLPKIPKRVEVHILRGSNLLLKTTFDLKCDGKTIELTPHPQS